MDLPINTDIEQCIPAAISIFQAYAGSTTESLARDPVTLSFTRGQLTTGESSSSQSSLLDLTHSTNTDTLPSQGYPVNVRNAPNGTNCLVQSSPASLKTKLGTGPTKGLSKRKRLSSPSDAELIERTTAWLKEGIEKLFAESSSGIACLPDDNFPYQLKGDANACAKYLWEWAKAKENASATVVWSMRYIAACLSLVGSVFTSSVMDLPVKSLLLFTESSQC